MTEPMNPAMVAAEPGYEEGGVCNRNGCTGIIAEHPVENCSCHIDPPCGACTTPREYCPVCDWCITDDETPFNDFLVGPVKADGAWTHYRPRPLDATKIDWHSKSHTSSSMIKAGVYPQSGDDEADRVAVLAMVKGTFGGRFNKFGNGSFEYVAYTD
jgi:hypothetical protein